MRVLFLSQAVPYPPHGGNLQRGYNILREASKFATIDLLAFSHPNVQNSREVLEESRRELGHFCESIEYFELKPKASRLGFAQCLFKSIVSGLPFSVWAFESRELRDAIRRLVASREYDLIHFDTIGLAQYLDLVPGIPNVVTHHNIESLLLERRAAVEKGGLRRSYLDAEARRMKSYEAKKSSLFDVNIVMSDEEKRLLTTIGGRAEVAVVPNGVDVDYYRRLDDIPEEPALIYTGGMGMYANRDAVVYFVESIYPLVKQERPDVKLFLIGKSPPKQLLDYAETDSSITVTGFVDDVRPWVSRCMVYVVPLRVGGGTRLKVLDAMSQKKAIVSTSIGCEGIKVTDNENILLADTPEDFAKGIQMLFENSALRESLGGKARTFVEKNYSWESIGERLKSAYRKACQSRGRDI